MAYSEMKKTLARIVIEIKEEGFCEVNLIWPHRPNNLKALATVFTRDENVLKYVVDYIKDIESLRKCVIRDIAHYRQQSDNNENDTRSSSN